MAFIRNTDKLVEGSSKLFFNNVRAKAAVQSDLDGLTAEDVGIKLRLDIVEGGAGVVGSIAKAQADAQSYTDQKIAALVNSAPEVLDTLKELSDALGGDASFASTVAGQIGSVDSKVDQEILDRQGAISALQSSLNSEISNRQSGDNALDLRLDVLELDPVTKSYVDGEIVAVEGQISAEQSRAEAAEAALDGRLDIIEGMGEGSVAKAEQDAKDYADSLNSAMDARVDALELDPVTKTYVDGEVFDLQGQITQEISDRQADVDAEETRAMAAESALDGRLDILEQDPTTKSYVDGEVSDLQGQITQEISDRQTAISSVEGMVEAEETRAMAAESALDGRLDVIEGSGAGSIAKSLVDAKAYADGLNSAMDSRVDALELDPVTKTYVDGIQSTLDGRLDVLESDPVTKTYVDGEISDLQGQVNTEKGRIDAILSASEADKDSFAEIVSLINSVDTANDSAFAGYVLSNDAALAQEVLDRQSGDSALSGRLDSLEADPTTKSYVDGIQSALDSRLDSLEADPTTKGYVDSELAKKVDVTQNYDIRPGMYQGGTKSSNFSINFANGPMQQYTLSGNVTVTFQNPVVGGSYLLKLVQDSTGGRQITWPSNIVWAEQLSPELSGANKVDFVQMLYDGTNYYASTQLADVTFARSSELSAEAATLQGNINAEAAARSAADSTLQSNINSEASSRAAEDLTFVKLDGSRAVTGELSMQGGMKVKHAEKSVSYTLLSSDYIVGVTAVSGGKTMTLPSAASVGVGKIFIIKDQSGLASNSNSITISPSGSEKIDGESNYVISVPYESIMVVSNGSDWYIV